MVCVCVCAWKAGSPPPRTFCTALKTFPQKIIKILENLLFHRKWYGSSFQTVLQRFSTAISIGIVFLIDLAIGQPPLTLASTSKPQYPCFSKFPNVATGPQTFDFVPNPLNFFPSYFICCFLQTNKTTLKTMKHYGKSQHLNTTETTKQTSCDPIRGSVNPKYFHPDDTSSWNR